jgi:hypothetical protein
LQQFGKRIADPGDSGRIGLIFKRNYQHILPNVHRCLRESGGGKEQDCAEPKKFQDKYIIAGERVITEYRILQRRWIPCKVLVNETNLPNSAVARKTPGRAIDIDGATDGVALDIRSISYFMEMLSVESRFTG